MRRRSLPRAGTTASYAKNTNEVFDNDDTLQEYGAIGSVRGRLGYAFNRLLLFGTAGLAFANITNNIQKGQNAGEQVVWENQLTTGWVAGGGVEYAFTNHFVGRIEYLYNNFGNVTLFNRDGTEPNSRTRSISCASARPTSSKPETNL
jgi:outer membrane immunogenic protein